jgi:16S rRNA (guanine527-N7)-methyltransferase
VAETAQAELERLLAGACADPDVVRRLARYGALVLAANRNFNVTGAKSESEIAEHIIDSLSVVPYVRAPFVDVGSGAGFPAIPVAVATGFEVTMIEATAKKARLLEEILDRLALKGQVVAERAETAGHRVDLRERFASGTCRAVATAAATEEFLLPLIAVGGTGILQRGRFDEGERTSLEDAALVLGGRLDQIVALENDRRIILVKKERSTSLRFPRRTGVAQKRPLCS